MAQPAGLFSVRRPRETLGNIQNFSGIPQPASAIKRASSSNDLRNAPFTASHVRSTSIQNLQRPAQPVFQRSSSGSNLADMGLSTIRRSASTSGHQGVVHSRQSLAPGSIGAGNLFGSQTPASASLQRRSSIYSRPSHHGPMAHQSFFTQPPAPAGAPRDPRPLRDRSYQEKIGQELLDYLTQNNFELEMKHSLRQDTLKSPHQKDFNLIFQWLYRRIDPGYKFQKSIDAEVPPILKQLRYPYGERITKSQINAVGGQNWSTFLGMLHWMMQLAQMLDNFSRGAYDDACAEAGVDVSGDRIVFRFLFGAYQDWLQVGTEEEDEAADQALVPHIQAMAAEFERINSRYAEELKIYEAESEALKAQVEELEKSAPDVAKLDKHFKILEDDKKKFEDYNANVQAKIEKYESRVKMLDAEIEKTEAELKQVEHERTTLQQSVDRQGLNVQDIDRMNTERDRLQKSYDDTVVALDEANRRVLEKEAEAARKLEDLEAVVKRYNSLCYQMSLIPSTAGNAKGAEYELSIEIPDNLGASTSQMRSSRRGGSPHGDGGPATSSDRLVSGPTTGHSPQHLLNLDLRSSVRPALVSLRKDVNERRKRLAETDLNAREFLESVSEALHEKNTEVDTLNHRVHLASLEHQALKESTQTQHTQSTSAIEKLEKDLGKLREGLDRGELELEQRELAVTMEWERMRDEATRVRERLHDAVERVIEDVVRFKMHVQRGLEEFEGWVGEEVEQELFLGEGAAATAGGGQDDDVIDRVRVMALDHEERERDAEAEREEAEWRNDDDNDVF